MAAWAHDAVFYHIYPLGMCGAPAHNDMDAAPVPRLAQVADWIGHMRELGANALYLGPLFEASSHGYDTADYMRVDRRLGDDTTLAELVRQLHEAGIRVILDGVFHHVGRDFWAFRDLQQHGARSRYRDWFAGVDFGGRSPYGDAFSYAAWQGHFSLVKLNLQHPEVRAHLLGAVRQWFNAFAIDGLRLDVADELDPAFVRELAAACRAANPDCWLLGEAIHGDYRRLVQPGGLDSATNYEAYKGLYSSHNDHNYFEIAYTLNRQFGAGGIYRDLPLYAFADNHDVDRVASTLHDPAHLYPLYALLFTMPGVPSIYYGSEWGLAGARRLGDDTPLRPALRWPEAARHVPHPDLEGAIAKLATVRHALPALRGGDYLQLHVAHEQLAFARRQGESWAVVAANASAAPAQLLLDLPGLEGRTLADQLAPGQQFSVRNGQLAIEVPPCWARVLAPA